MMIMWTYSCLLLVSMQLVFIVHHDSRHCRQKLNPQPSPRLHFMHYNEQCHLSLSHDLQQYAN